MNLQQKVIKNKLGLLNLAEELGNVSRACRVMGFSRDTFYRYQEMVEKGGTDALIEKPRSKPNFANRVPEEVEREVLALAFERPELGQVRVADELKSKGLFVCPATVCNIRKRHGLSTFQLRLKKLEERARTEGIVLTEHQKLA